METKVKSRKGKDVEKLGTKRKRKDKVKNSVHNKEARSFIYSLYITSDEIKEMV